MAAHSRSRSRSRSRSVAASDLIRSLCLVFLSLITLPVSLCIVIICLLSQTIRFRFQRLPRHNENNHTLCTSISSDPDDGPREEEEERKKTILVTGVGMAKGLTLARAFHLCGGHRVIGADFEDGLFSSSNNDDDDRGIPIPCSGRFSRSLSRFYRLPRPGLSKPLFPLRLPLAKSDDSSSSEKIKSGSNNSSGGGSSKYAEFLLDIIRREKVDLWVSCSGVVTALDDAVAKELIESESQSQTQTEHKCKCAQFDVPTTSLLHSKSSFMKFCAEKGLSAPHTVAVSSTEDVMRVLRDNDCYDNYDDDSNSLGGTNKNEKEKGRRGRKSRKRKRKYILKPADTLDDVYRITYTPLPLSSSSSSSSSSSETETETAAHVSALPISAANPWVLQQYIASGAEYCTHALVVRGELRYFVACPSSEFLLHYVPLPLAAEDGTADALRMFTEEFLEKLPLQDRKRVTGHLSFDFMVDEWDESTGEEEEEEENSGDARGNGNEQEIQNNKKKNKKRKRKIYYAIECNPRAHTAVVLFGQQGPEMQAMVQAYLSILDPDIDTNTETETVEQQDAKLSSASSSAEDDGKTERRSVLVTTPPPSCVPRYWIAHDIITLLIQPVLHLVTRGGPSGDIVASWSTLLRHVFTWKEGTFEVWDPLPAFVLYHVYYPLTILSALWLGRRWSRTNVSTARWFRC